jgi:DNA invertase Pin-like site-specific DNA recombinase
MNPKITEQHRSRPAYIYVRQSTNAQVLHHQESTERQYALRAMALELGWSESAIRTLDRDLGMTGTEMTRREDFKTLVADVSMGQVGARYLRWKFRDWRARISTGIGCWSCVRSPRRW